MIKIPYISTSTGEAYEDLRYDGSIEDLIEEINSEDKIIKFHVSSVMDCYIRTSAIDCIEMNKGEKKASSTKNVINFEDRIKGRR